MYIYTKSVRAIVARVHRIEPLEGSRLCTFYALKKFLRILLQSTVQSLIQLRDDRCVRLFTRIAVRIVIVGDVVVVVAGGSRRVRVTVRCRYCLVLFL